MNKTKASISQLTNHFNDLLADFPLVLVDVGAKGGCKSCWKPILPYLRVLAFEPDARSALDGESWLTVVPIGLSNKKGTSRLYLTRGRSQSSLLNPNEDWAARLPEGDRMDVIGTETVDVDTLDDQFRKSGFKYADFLDLNTQGSEFWILQGGEQTLQQSVLGFDVEVNFAPRYHGQPPFGEIDLLANKHGFELFDVKRGYCKRTIGAKTGGRYGQLSHGHALYFSSRARLAALLESSSSPEERKARLVRAGVILMLFGYSDCALELVHDWKQVFTDAEYRRMVEIVGGNVELWARLPNFRGRGRLATLFQELGDLLEPVNPLGVCKDPRLGNIYGYTRVRKSSRR